MTRFDRTTMKTARARTLRRNATGPEQKLWFRLRGAQMLGRSFRRQHPVGPYILDFYCAIANLAVELDGEQHGSDEGRMRDEARTRNLALKGIRVLRFWNHELKENFDNVLEGISRALSEAPTQNAARPDLSLSGGGTPISDL